jgi:DNA-directed RNA polymerase specialized sigma24 family protein
MTSRFEDGHEPDLTEVCGRYADDLLGTALFVTGDRSRAEEALHDTFLRAAEAGALHFGDGRLRGRLFTMLLAEVRSQETGTEGFRGRAEGGPSGAHAGVGDEPAGLPEPDEAMSRRELAELIRQAAGVLEPPDRDLLELHLCAGLDVREVADALGEQVPRAAARLGRARVRTEQAVGALMLARYGPRTCNRLNRILDGWDGGYTAAMHSRLTGHAATCAACRREWTSGLSVDDLRLALRPVPPAPAFWARLAASLKARRLPETSSTTSVATSSTAGTEPPATNPPSTGPRTIPLIAGGISAVVVTGGVLAALLASGAVWDGAPAVTRAVRAGGVVDGAVEGVVDGVSTGTGAGGAPATPDGQSRPAARSSGVERALRVPTSGVLGVSYAGRARAHGATVSARRVLSSPGSASGRRAGSSSTGSRSGSSSTESSSTRSSSSSSSTRSSSGSSAAPEAVTVPGALAQPLPTSVSINAPAGSPATSLNGSASSNGTVTATTSTSARQRHVTPTRATPDRGPSASPTSAVPSSTAPAPTFASATGTGARTRQSGPRGS